jgi:hypothetical protein
MPDTRTWRARDAPGQLWCRHGCTRAHADLRRRRRTRLSIMRHCCPHPKCPSPHVASLPVLSPGALRRATCGAHPMHTSAADCPLRREGLVVIAGSRRGFFLTAPSLCHVLRRPQGRAPHGCVFCACAAQRHLADSHALLCSTRSHGPTSYASSSWLALDARARAVHLPPLTQIVPAV